MVLRSVLLASAAMFAVLSPVGAVPAHAEENQSVEHWDYAGSGIEQREYHWLSKLWGSAADNKVQPGVCLVTGKIKGSHNWNWPMLEWTEVSGHFSMTAPDGSTNSGTFGPMRVIGSKDYCVWGSTTLAFQPGTYKVSMEVNLHGRDNRPGNTPWTYEDHFEHENMQLTFSHG